MNKLSIEQEVSMLDKFYEKAFELTLSRVMVTSRRKSLLYYRRLAVYWLYQNTNKTTKQIADHFGVQNTMIIGDYDASRKQIDSDIGFCSDYNKLVKLNS